MKSRKKWSIPIALAVVLMLVASLGVSSLVMAQSTGAKTVNGGGDKFEDAESLKAGDVIAIITIPEGDKPASGGKPAIDGLNKTDSIAIPPIVDEDVVGYDVGGADASLFSVDGKGEVKIKDDDALAVIKDASKKAVFTFDVLVYVDTDTTTDSGKGYRDPTKMAAPDNPDQPGGTTTGDDQKDDKDEVNKTTVTLYAFKFDRSASALAFETVGATASVGERLYGADGVDKAITVKGIPSGGKVTGTVSSGDYQADISGNMVYIAHSKPSSAKTENVDVNLTVDVGTDTDNDGKNETKSLTKASASILARNELLFERTGNTEQIQITDTDGTVKDAEAFIFHVQSNARDGELVGTISIMGATADDNGTETIDETEKVGAVVSPSSMPFDVEARKSNGEYDQVRITVDGALPASMAGRRDFQVSISGEGPARRTDITWVRVNVTAADAGPALKTGVVLVDGEYEVTVPENDKKAEFLLKRDGDDVGDAADHLVGASGSVIDFSALVEDADSDADELTYTDTSGKFNLISSGKLVLVSDVRATDSAVDDDATTTVDESKTLFGKRTDGGKLVGADDKGRSSNRNADITYEFSVTVTDEAANSLTIPVLLTLDVNEPAGPDMASDDRIAAAYSSNDPIGHPIYDLTTVVKDPDGDVLDYTLVVITDDPATTAVEGGSDLPVPFNVDESGMIEANWTGLRVEEDIVWHIDVTIDDPYENTAKYDDDGKADTPAKCCFRDAVVPLQIKLLAPEPQQAGDLSYTVKEHAAAGAIVGSVAEDENGDPVISDAANYSITHATGGAAGADGAAGTADDDFELLELNDDFLIVVKKGRDFEGDDKIAMPNTLTLIVEATGSANEIRGQIIVGITIEDEPEAPTFGDDAPTTGTIAETGKAGRSAMVMNDAGVSVPMVIAASDKDAADTGANLTISSGVKVSSGVSSPAATVPFYISDSGAITEDGELEAGDSYILTITATDRRYPALTDTHEVTISVGDINEAPYFTKPSGEDLTIDVPENVDRTAPIVTFEAMDPDANDTLKFSVRDEADKTFFSIDEESGELTLVKDLDYETADKRQLEAHVVVTDAAGLSDRVKLIVNVGNENDNPPIFTGSGDGSETMAENAPHGTVLGDYSATDADNLAPIIYDLEGSDEKSFQISDTGMLMTLEALDADSQTPCGSAGCDVTVVARDGMKKNDARVDVEITVTNVEDSVSIFDISKANPVHGVTKGEPMTALGDAKESISASVPESPANLPATKGDGPENFVDTQWANWGTVLRIEVTSESPGPTIHQINPPANACRGGNECVKITLKSDSGDETLVLEAYRSTEKDNLFIAAVKPVSGEEGMESTYAELLEDWLAAADNNTADNFKPSAVYAHTDGTVARLKVDEEDEITIEFVNLRGTIDVENEKPEFGNFAPEHESAFDDGDVDYTFTIIDSVSGIPEPEDLPDEVDGDGDYMPVVALISTYQCHSKEPELSSGKVDKSFTMYERSGNNLWCKSAPETRQIVDDRDFDEIDDGFDIDTKIVLPENRVRYVSFIACDAAGNCALYTPDENDTDEALAEITIDTLDPELIEARTGIKWDSTDSEYDDDRSFIQLLFEDLTALNPDTIEADDFVVEGHTVKAAHWYDVSDNDDDTRWGDDDADTKPGRYADGGVDNLDDHPLRRSIRNVVFLELEDELAPDETPDVTVVPNGIEDSAGNEQDDGDVEADDWISPSFTVTSIVSPRTPEGSSNVLAGDGDEVVITLTSDERIQQTRPDVSVTHVDAPAGSVYTDTEREGCKKAGDPADRTKWTGTRVRGEIVNSDDCLDSEAEGEEIGTSIEKVSNTEWIITVDEPDATGYYSFYVFAQDRSAQKNPGNEGVKPSNLVKDFFERDGDVNSDDAHYFQGDINLSNPGVRVSGMQIEDTEPAVEFKTPLFVELDFTRAYISDCTNVDDKDEIKANCRNEKEEYAKDSFENVTVTSFVLNGVDMTDSVKTTDDKTFLVSIVSIGIGDHEIEVQAMDQAGNTLDEALSIEFEVEERDPFSRRLNPGWNLVSLPGEPADSDISVVFGSNVEVRTVYTYDPIIPGGWMVAVRETLSSDWQGDLMDITARRGYWVLSDAIQDWEVSIPRLAGGAVGSGTPIQPPVIGLYAGWNLIPVVDVRGGALDDGKVISATAYLNSLDDGLDLARVLGFNTITNTWTTVLDPDDTDDDAGQLRIGSGYWVFVREAASLVPGGVAKKPLPQ